MIAVVLLGFSTSASMTVKCDKQPELQGVLSEGPGCFQAVLHVLPFQAVLHVLQPTALLGQIVFDELLTMLALTFGTFSQNQAETEANQRGVVVRLPPPPVGHAPLGHLWSRIAVMATATRQ